jgi:signal recognition particle receptor subunit beta
VAEIRSDRKEINARIVYWGIPGAGISANLAMIHGKLKGDNRGALRRIPTRIDPTIEYEVLPIELGEVNGVRTRLHVIGVPGAAEQSPTRKQLLDRIDGVVFVADSRPECMEANVESLGELVEFLRDYGCTPNELPFVIQYNKCDLVDPFVIERLHRQIQIQGAAVYEASAKTGTGVLKTLTTISKLVIRYLGRREEARPAADASDPGLSITQAARVEKPAPQAPAESNDSQTLMENAILAEAADNPALHAEVDAAGSVANDVQAQFDQPWDAVSKAVKPNNGARIGADFRIVSVGDATRRNDRAISVPLVLGNDEGETITMALTIQLDPLLDGDS